MVALSAPRVPLVFSQTGMDLNASSLAAAKWSSVQSAQPPNGARLVGIPPRFVKLGNEPAVMFVPLNALWLRTFHFVASLRAAPTTIAG